MTLLRTRQLLLIGTIVSLSSDLTNSLLTRYSNRNVFRRTPTTTILLEDEEARPFTRLHGSLNYASTEVPRMDFRALSETTRGLLTGIPVGEWNRSSFESVEMIVESWATGNSKRSALNAERLVRRVIEEQKIGNPYADQIDLTNLYQVLIQAWADSRETGGAERAEEILDYLQEIYDNGDSEDPMLCGPGLESFNAVIHAYARSGRQDAPEQALRVLEKLYDWNIDRRTFATPNKETYAAVLRAWARRGSDAPKLIRRLLDHMEELSKTYPLVKPDFRCHNAYLFALLEAISRGDTPKREAAVMAEDYLRAMQASPDEEVQVSWNAQTCLVCFLFL
jgi:hypothetical protein